MEQHMKQSTGSHVKDGLIDFTAGFLALSGKQVSDPLNWCGRQMGSETSAFAANTHLTYLQPSWGLPKRQLVDEYYNGYHPCIHSTKLFIGFSIAFIDGGVALVYVGQPLDTIKVKMQTFPAVYSNMIDCFIKTLKTDGLAKGLYAGTVPALAANIAENSILFLGYGFCQKFMQRVTGTEKVEDLSILSNATAGCLAAFYSSIGLTPTELIKCKLQAMYEMQKAEAEKGNKIERVGPFQLTAQILRKEGIRGMFRGLVATLAREMPGYFFFFGGYEGTRMLFCKPGQSKDDLNLFQTMVSGAAGGMIFWVITYPIDLAKSRIQVYNQQGSLHRIIIDVARQEGVRALFTGLTPTLVRTIPATATLFVTYEYSKRFLHNVLD